MSALAQIATNTSLVGTVADQTGKVVAGAKVVATNTGTQESYTATTNEEGYYALQFVKIGTYDLAVSSPGFQTYKKVGVVVEINQVVRNDIPLKVGDVVQSMTVEATTPAIQTDDASISEVINEKAVADLPLNGRDPLRLAITTPGVLPGLKSPNGVPPGQDFIGAGTREITNSLSLDGISILNNLITTSSFRPSVDSVQEFQVQTGTYSAQYGSYMGVHVNLITKSGTNGLHGTASEFLRNNILDARGFFEDRTKPQPPLRQNQFGFELDGPVMIPKLYNGRDKTFFMGSYEGLRQVRQSSQLATVLTPLMRQGNFSEYTGTIHAPGSTAVYPGNIIPAAQLSPIALKVLQYLPPPNLPCANGASYCASNYAANLPNNVNTDQTVDRVDQNIGDKIRIFFRYAYQNTSYLTGAANPFSGTTSPTLNKNFTIGYTHSIRPNLINDFRIGRQRFDTSSVNYWYTNGQKDAGSQLGIPGFTGDVAYNNPGIPDFNITGFQGVGNGGSNWFQDDTTWQASEQISWNRGAHNIMAGAEFRRFDTGRQAANSARGVFNFNGQITGFAPADFLLGFPQSLSTAGPEIRGEVAEWRDGFFVLDNWQVNRKLTVNIGLRYELPTVPYTVNGNATELNPQQTALIPANAPVKGFKFINPNHKDFAPRIGFAYRLTEKTVFRGGFGLYFNPNQTNSFTFLNTNPPFSPIVSYTSLPAAPTLSLASGSPSTSPATTAPPNVITDNPNLPTSYMNQWSFSAQREVWKNAAVDVQYLGSHTLHLDRNYYNNTPLPGPGAVNPRRPNPLFTVIRTIQNDMVSNYEGLSVVLRQRFSGGLQFLASYTWAHALDVTSDSNNGGQPMDPYNWRRDYGNSNWDVRHRFVGSFNYDLPFFKGSKGLLKYTLGGWQTNGIVTLQGGFPFNVSIGTDVANTATNGTQRPNVVGTPSENCGSGHLTNCISAAAFALPAPYTYGNAGRNILRGPGLYNIDYSLFKVFPLGERFRLQFRSEFFNLFNTPHFSNPNTTFNTAAFGTVTSTASDNREIQFALKLNF